MRRLNLNIPDKVGQRLEAMKLKLEVETYTSVITRSLAITETIIDHDLKGGKVLLEAADGSIVQLQLR